MRTIFYTHARKILAPCFWILPFFALLKTSSLSLINMRTVILRASFSASRKNKNMHAIVTVVCRELNRGEGRVHNGIDLQV